MNFTLSAKVIGVVSYRASWWASPTFKEIVSPWTLYTNAWHTISEIAVYSCGTSKHLMYTIYSKTWRLFHESAYNGKLHNNMQKIYLRKIYWKICQQNKGVKPLSCLNWLLIRSGYCVYGRRYTFELLVPQSFGTVIVTEKQHIEAFNSHLFSHTPET